jgi:hypothetical protein
MGATSRVAPGAEPDVSTRAVMHHDVDIATGLNLVKPYADSKIVILFRPHACRNAALHLLLSLQRCAGRGRGMLTYKVLLATSACLAVLIPLRLRRRNGIGTSDRPAQREEATAHSQLEVPAARGTRCQALSMVLITIIILAAVRIDQPSTSRRHSSWSSGRDADLIAAEDDIK